MSRYLIFLFAFSLTGCLEFNWPTIQEPPITELFPPQTLLDAPTTPHNREVEVFFSNVSVPNRPFLQLKYITITYKGHGDVHPTVLELKKEAQKLGGDGIVITNVKKWIHDGWVGDTPYSTLQTDVEAMVFIYPDNLEFQEKMLKSWTLYTHNEEEDKWTETGKVNYAMGGHPTGKEGDTTRLDWWMERSVERLVTEKQIMGIIQRDDMGREIGYTLASNRSRITISYDTKGRILYLVYKRLNQDPERIRYIYDDDDRIKHRVLSSIQEGYRWVENWEYTDSGEINGFRFNSMIKGNKESDFFIKPTYYTYKEWERHKDAIVESELGTF